jgi:hypothetical protein
MDYKNPDYADLGGIGAPMNPFVDQALRFGPTRLLADPDAGMFNLPVTGLNGRHFDRNFFEVQPFELSGNHADRNYFYSGAHAQLYGWRDALDVFTAASFLFPE